MNLVDMEQLEIVVTLIFDHLFHHLVQGSEHLSDCVRLNLLERVVDRTDERYSRVTICLKSVTTAIDLSG